MVTMVQDSVRNFTRHSITLHGVKLQGSHGLLVRLRAYSRRVAEVDPS